jgi:NAD(P)-dependent dehydrogenase (short-subunit alcohol dehydrogenase family)
MGMAGAFKGRHVLVTGGSRGIGHAIAEAFALEGAEVTITGRDPAALDAAVASGAAHCAEAFDIRDLPALQAGVARITARRPVDILVNNAGTAFNRPFLKQNAGDLQDMLADHVIAPAEIIRLALPGMQASGFGRILNIGSTASVKGYAFVAGYVAAKHGLLGLTRSLALEFAASGITVNAICPGYTATDLVMSGMDARAAKEGSSREAVLTGFLKNKPMGRLVKPEEIASTALWLASEGAASVTGQAIIVDGGESVA